MQKISLKAEKRSELGKGGARTLRRSDMLPAVLYSKKISTPIKLNKKDITKLMVSGGREHALVNIKLSGGKGEKSEHWVLVKDYQIDPLKNELLHVDFMEISLKEKIKTIIPIVITNEPIGVKNGGILQQQLRDIEVECLPTEMPDGINVDASSVDIGHTLHVSDIEIKEGVKILNDPQDAILSVKAPVVEEVAVPETTEEEAEEPEVVKKGKEKEGEEAKEEPAPAEEQKDKKEK